MITRRRRFALAEVCPDSHHEPHPSAPVQCPAWCARQHPTRLWLGCCTIVVHSVPLALSADQRLTVRLEQVETDAGAEPASLTADHAPAPGHDPLTGLSPGQADDYAVTLRRASLRARNLTDTDPNGTRP